MTPDQTNATTQAQTNQGQTPLQANTVELNFDLHLEDAQPTTPVVTEGQEPVVETPVESPMIQLDLPTQPSDVQDTSWLQDAQPTVEPSQEAIVAVEEQKKSEEPIIQEKIAEQEQTLEFLTPTDTPVETPVETPAETPVETPVETPAETPVETPAYVPTADAFNQTVDALKQQEGKQGEVSLTSQEQATQPFSGGVNLDDVLKTLTPTSSQAVQQPEVVASPVVETVQPVVAEQTVNPFQVQDMSASQFAAVSQPASAPVVESAQPVYSHDTKHGIAPLKIVGLSFVLLILGGFVVKTMYPVEFNSLLANVFGTAVQEQIVTEDLLTGSIITGDVLSGDMLVTTDLLSGEQDASTGFDAFTELDTLGGTEAAPIVNPHQDTILQLQDFAVKGQEYLDLGRQTSDTVLTKYGLFISKKATELATSLENGEQIDTQVVETYIASFSGYLNKLSLIVNDTEPQAIVPVQEDQPAASSGEIPMIDMNSGSEEIPAVIN